MKARMVLPLSFVLMLVMSGCSPVLTALSSAPRPGPIVDMESRAGGYQPIIVDDVQVQTGIGPDAPVIVRITGVLPDTCSQLEYAEIRRENASFVIDLAATPGAEGCVEDTVPFSLSLPLNTAGRSAGVYPVAANGIRTEFTLPGEASAEDKQAAGSGIIKSDIEVDEVRTEVGAGQPIPLHAVVSGMLPSACASLGEVRMHFTRSVNVFFVRLVAYTPGQARCAEAPTPFELEVPINTVNLPDGAYSLNINGTGTGFRMPLEH